MVRYDKRAEIVKQALQEIAHADHHKRKKIPNWHRNEQIYYGKKQRADDSRANVELGRAQEFVHTLLSKIDNPLTFKFTKRKLSQLKRVARLNSLKEFDGQRNFWDLKDLVGKKQAIIYGRAIFFYHATPNYAPHLENVDVYDFLVDPTAGGIDIEQAKYLGRYGVVKSKKDIKKGPYIKSEVDLLLSGEGNSEHQIDQDKRERDRALNTEEKKLDNQGDYTFWEWFTTYEGDRYYLLMDNGGRCIRCEPLKEVFESELYPVWTYAAFPDLTEFWTPAYLDYVREIFMAQAVSINQMLDNAERVNKPQRAIDTGAIQDLAELKYKKDGYIRMNPGTNIDQALKLVQVPSIETPIAVFNILEGIQEKAMGVSAAEKGLAETDGRATIYEGNRQTAADRYGLLNKSYSYGYRRFATLYENGVREHLNKKVAVDILGPEGIEVENVSKRDIFRKDDHFAVMVEASDAEMSISENKKRTMLAFLSAHLQSPIINQKKSVEIQAHISGLNEQEIRELLDVSEFGDAQIMSEAERDIEDLLDGKILRPNRMANTAYKQRIVNYVNDNMEHMTQEQIGTIFMYIESLDEIVMANTIRKAQEQGAQQGEMPEAGRLRAPGPAQPLQDVIQQNT